MSKARRICVQPSLRICATWLDPDGIERRLDRVRPGVTWLKVSAVAKILTRIAFIPPRADWTSRYV